VAKLIMRLSGLHSGVGLGATCIVLLLCFMWSVVCVLSEA
jgi:hypothetical protein